MSAGGDGLPPIPPSNTVLAEGHIPSVCSFAKLTHITPSLRLRAGSSPKARCGLDAHFPMVQGRKEGGPGPRIPKGSDRGECPFHPCIDPNPIPSPSVLTIVPTFAFLLTIRNQPPTPQKKGKALPPYRRSTCRFLGAGTASRHGSTGLDGSRCQAGRRCAGPTGS